MLQSVAQLLRQFDYASVLFTSAGVFAIHKDFDNVRALLDLNLGDGSSLELRGRLKAANLSIVYMIGNDSPAVRAAALQSGCVAYLTKPFSARDDAEKLQRAQPGSFEDSVISRLSSDQDQEPAPSGV